MTSVSIKNLSTCPQRRVIELLGNEMWPPALNLSKDHFVGLTIEKWYTSLPKSSMFPLTSDGRSESFSIPFSRRLVLQLGPLSF